jgi:uncharacterized membrane protein YedE/YeeE
LAPIAYFSLLLAGILGFVLHRSGLCMVRTVAEIFSSRRANMLAGILKTALWVFTVLLIWTFLLGDRNPFNENYALTYPAIVGGFFFGVGAAVNGGCAFSTLSHLVNGKIWMLVTLVGFSFGIAGITFVLGRPVAGQIQPSLLSDAPANLLIVLMILLGILMCLEIYRLWSSRTKNIGFRHLLFFRPYRQSTSSLLIGICGGVLYILHDNWTYTSMLKTRIQGAIISNDHLQLLHFYLFVAVFVGMVVSALLQKSVKLRIKPTKKWVEYLVGGAFMGGGTVLIPGGNDTLILKSIPVLSFHAIPTFAALLCGIAITLYAKRYVSGKTMKVVCNDDICMEKE